MPRLVLRAMLPTCPAASGMRLALDAHLSPAPRGAPGGSTHSHHSPGPRGPALTPMCPLQSWGSSRARQSLRSLSTGPGPPGTGASLLPLAPVGAGLGPGAL